jgi:hypothetical protein
MGTHPFVIVMNYSSLVNRLIENNIKDMKSAIEAINLCGYVRDDLYIIFANEQVYDENPLEVLEFILNGLLSKKSKKDIELSDLIEYVTDSVEVNNLSPKLKKAYDKYTIILEKGRNE